jgi:putative hydrolase of the HAD superfamily
MKSRRIRAVIFDLDNTLIDFARMKRLSCEAAIDAMIDSGLHISRSKALKILFGLYDKYGWEHQKIFQIFLKEVAGEVDYRILVPGILAYRKIKDGLLYSYPGVNHVLGELKKEGYMLAVLSDAPRIQAWLRLCSLRIHDKFDEIVTFDDTKRRKPDKRPFMLALKKLGIMPEEAVMVGDSVKRDMATARQLGMVTILARYGHVRSKIGNYGQLRAERGQADYEIRSIASILGAVRKINRGKARHAA